MSAMVITILQPWASLTVTGFKTLETRSWSTSYRGRLYIHSSKSKRGTLWAMHHRELSILLPKLQLVYGAVIGNVDLTDITPLALPLSPNDYGWLVDGNQVWHFKDPKTMAPVYKIGKQGLWSTTL